MLHRADNRKPLPPRSRGAWGRPKLKTLEAMEELTLPLKSQVDVLKARQYGKRLAIWLHFNGSEIVKITTAISEIARNAVLHAKGGLITIRLVQENEKRGMVMITEDRGPGIPDVARAMQDGYSTARSLGIGLSAARRMMDEFEIETNIGKGTVVTMKKWKQ